jgi:hypothetical protein
MVAAAFGVALGRLQAARSRDKAVPSKMNLIVKRIVPPWGNFPFKTPERS